MQEMQKKWETQMQSMHDMFLNKFEQLKSKNQILFNESLQKETQQA